MDKLISKRKYIIFGNFPDCDTVAKEMSEKLDIDCAAFLSKTDNVSIIAYEEEDSELIQLRKENKELKLKLSKKWF